jgi:hypothetical protein
VIEPRKKNIGRPTSLVRRKALGDRTRILAGTISLPGVLERGMFLKGFPGNLGGLLVSRQESRRVQRVNKGPGHGVDERKRCHGAKQAFSTGIGHRGKTGGVREGRAEVGVSHSTQEAGEPVQKGLGGGKGMPGQWNRWRERQWEHRVL